MPRLAAIDVGTNSVRLLVAELPASGAGGVSLRPVLRRLAVTRLGEGLDEGGYIRQVAAARTAAAVEEFAATAIAAGAPPPVVVATYAMRAARNPEILLERLRRPVRVLSGEDEAKLGFLGAVAGLNRGTTGARLLVLDIGGGSVELTRGTARGIEETHSLPLGCVVLTHRFLAHDPPQRGEIEGLRAHVARALGVLLDRSAERLDVVIGVGGTITTMAAMAQRLVPYDPDRIHGYRLELPEIAAALDALSARPLEARRKLPGLHPDRADVIIAGALVLDEVVRGLGRPPVVVSEADILWALLMNS